MKWEKLVRESLAKDARISVGFGNGVSFQHGLVNSPYDVDSATDQGDVGIVIPVAGCKHIKTFLGAD